MSQRRKGPGRPPTSSTIPSLPSDRPPARARAVLLPFPPKHEIFLRSEAPLGACVSICPFVCPTRPRVQPWRVDRAGAAAVAGSLTSPLLPPPCPIPSSV